MGSETSNHALFDHFIRDSFGGGSEGGGAISWNQSYLVDVSHDLLRRAPASVARLAVVRERHRRGKIGQPRGLSSLFLFHLHSIIHVVFPARGSDCRHYEHHQYETHAIPQKRTWDYDYISPQI